MTDFANQVKKDFTMLKLHMAQKLSITIFLDRTPKNQTFLKTACKSVD